LAQHVTRGARVSHDDGAEPPEKLPSARVAVDTRRHEAGQPANSFTETGGATVAALLHLLRLLGAELVLVRGIEITQFEQAVRAKIGDFTSPTANGGAREVGLAHARYLLEQVLTQVRAQAELKKSLSVAAEAVEPARATHPDGGSTHVAAPKLLN
jgi:hypothetical protein